MPRTAGDPPAGGGGRRLDQRQIGTSRAGSGPAPQNVFINPIIIVTPGRGVFIYSPVPGPNNLIASIAPASGTDPYGNQFLAGFTSYASFLGTFYAASLTQAGVGFFTGGATESTPYVALHPGLGLNVLGTETTLNLAGTVTMTGFGGVFSSPIAAWVAPSGDTTGAQDAAAIQAALTAGALVNLLPGTFYVNATITLGLNRYIRGSGMGQTIITNRLAAHGPTIQIVNSGAYSATKFAGIYDLTVEGTGAPANSIGVQFGDIAQIQLSNVAVQNFSGGTGTGFYGLNANHFTEQLHGSVFADNCDLCIVFDVSGGTVSFERMSLDCWVAPNAAGVGVNFRNGAMTNHGRLRIMGNFQTTGIVLSLSGSGSSFIGKAMQLDIGVECDASAGTGPQTIFFGAAGNTIQAYGEMEFLLTAGVAFTASNNAGNLSYYGRIDGDTTLQQNFSIGEWTTISTGFPAGWTGTIDLRHDWDSGDVTLLWSLAIANGTVVTAGETVLAAASIAASFRPLGTKQLAAHAIVGGGVAANTFAGMQVTSAGGLGFQGAGFTPAGGSSFWNGQAIYSNSI